MNMKLFWACLFCFALGGISAQVSGDDAREIAVLSYNIHHGEGTDGRVDLARIAGVINSVAPDVVALQEVDRNVARTGDVDQLAQLARMTGMEFAFGANLDLQGGQYGNAVLSRLPIVRSQNHLLPNLNDGEPRGVLAVDLKVPGRAMPIRVLATHFDHRPDEQERIASAKFVGRLMNETPDQPAILAGDLNATPDSETLKIIQADWTRTNAKPMATIPVEQPQRQIDYVLFRPESHWQPVSTEVLDEAVASDHRPLLARLKPTAGDVPAAARPNAKARPNVLFISMDDLNDWIGVMGGHRQALTPNLDRLAKQSVLFTNAHCAAPACNPSRTAIFTGRSPNRSGLYDNRQVMREVLPDAEIIPKRFSRHGYYSGGSGKLLHYFIDAPSWDEYFPEAESENPFPQTNNPPRAERPINLPRGGPWQYSETDWAALDQTDEQYGGDYLVAEWISEKLSKSHDRPFFLGCGIYRPHEPWFVPKKYFKPFPLESIELPPGYKPDDLEDLPPAGKQRGPNRYFAHIREQGQWKQAIQGYLASIHYADAMLGRVLDALESGPNADSTILVLWSDHGWHLGEKQHWQKYTAWRVCTRVPLIVRVPEGTPGLPPGTTPAECDRPVSLVSLFPTLLELCGLPAEAEHDGPSLLPLLRDAEADWPHVAVTYLGEPGSYGLSDQRWRLIHYANGDEELYDVSSDRYEWNNLAGDPDHASQLELLRAKAPQAFAPKPEPSIDSLNKLPWQPVGDVALPASKPVASPFPVYFINRSAEARKLFWMDRHGEPKFYAELKSAEPHRQQTRPGAVWMISDANDRPLGYFRVDDRTARAVIPK